MDRACRRVLQMVGHSGAAEADAATVVGLVTHARELAWQCCLLGHERAPGAAEQVPAAEDLAAAHHGLSRTATACAQVAQALVISTGADAPLRAGASAVARAEEALAALRPAGAAP